MLQTVKQQQISLQIALLLTNEVFTTETLAFSSLVELLPVNIKFQREYWLKKYHKLQLFSLNK